MVQTFVFLFLSMLNWKYCFRVTPTCIKGLDGWKPPTSITQQPTSDPQTYSEPLHFQHLGQESVHVIAHGSGGSRQLYIKKKVNTYKHRHTHICLFIHSAEHFSIPIVSHTESFLYCKSSTDWFSNNRWFFVPTSQTGFVVFSWFTWCSKKCLEFPGLASNLLLVDRIFTGMHETLYHLEPHVRVSIEWRCMFFKYIQLAEPSNTGIVIIADLDFNCLMPLMAVLFLHYFVGCSICLLHFKHLWC